MSSAEKSLRKYAIVSSRVPRSELEDVRRLIEAVKDFLYEGAIQFVRRCSQVLVLYFPI